MSDGTLNLAEQKHRDFLNKLATDDETRSAYQTDPLGVLAKHGIGHDPNNPPTPGALPSKEALSGILDGAVKTMNESGGHPSSIMGTPSFTFDIFASQ